MDTTWPDEGKAAKSTSPRTGMNGEEKLRDAFWRLLEQRSYASMNVRDIVRVAAVNKNTFYYHYANLEELAADAIASMLPYEFYMLVVRSLLTGRAQESMKFDSAPDAAQIMHKLGYLQLLAGPHGTAELRALAKRTFIEAWCGVTGMQPERFGDESMLAIDFVFGGIMGMLMHCAVNERTAGGGVTVETVMDTDFFRRLTSTLPPVVWHTLEQDGVQLPEPLHDIANRETQMGVPRHAASV